VWSYQTGALSCIVVFPVEPLPPPSVTLSMTTDAKCNQVVHRVAAESTPGFQMMDLQVLRDTAVLAVPCCVRFGCGSAPAAARSAYNQRQSRK